MAKNGIIATWIVAAIVSAIIISFNYNLMKERERLEACTNRILKLVEEGKLDRPSTIWCR